MSMPRAARATLTPARVLAALLLAFIVVAGSAMLSTSTTFDEIVFPAVGARGFATGDFGMVTDHPRLPQYLYGLLPYLSGAKIPPDSILAGDWYPRYHFARAFLWGAGNNPERIVLMTRILGLAFGALAVAATYLVGKRHLGAWGAVFAAALVAFLPDMLGHSGVAYNDVPLAFGLLVALYALDAAVRTPAPSRVALAALAFALTACIKYSGLVLGPALVILVALEALSGRLRDRAWRRAILAGVPLFVAVVYATIVAVYLGDWRLGAFVQGLGESIRGSAAGRVAFLLGERYAGGKWYFFPIAFFLKTPLALHVFMLVAVVGAWGAARAMRWRHALAHGARAPAVGATLFLAALMASSINIGFRHALPMLPLVCILVAQGAAPVWGRGRFAVRAALGAVLATFLLSSGSHYPYFISYLSEYAQGRPLHETLVDSSTDWGQGLVALHRFMRERGVDEVALGYFGSALPEGYAIRYVPMPSYYTLAPQSGSPGSPRYLVVSATLLAGEYVAGDPYAQLRKAKPVAILADTLYVFDRGALGKL